MVIRSLVVLLLAACFTGSSAAQVAIQYARCSSQNVVGNYGSLKIENLIINCGEKSDARTALKVSYFWLDAFSASLLVAGHNDSRLTSLLGSRPILIRNGVSQTMQDLVDRFGTRVGSHSAAAGDTNTLRVEGRNGSSMERAVKPEVYGKSNFSKFKIFDGLAPIYWPDLPSMRLMQKGNEFPSKYRSYVKRFDQDGSFSEMTSRKLNSTDHKAISDAALVSRVFRRNIDRQELIQYKTSLEELREAALAGSIKVYFPVGVFPAVPEGAVKSDSDDYDALYKKEEIRRIVSFAGTKTYAALRFITSQGMPDDFISLFGIHEDHVGAPLGWAIQLIPRRPFMKIAVIENAATTATDYSFGPIRVSTDGEVALRKPPEVASKIELLDFPSERLSHRERVIVPLSIEFRDHPYASREDYPDNLSPDDSAAKLLSRLLDRYPYSDIVQRADDGKPINEALSSKPKTLFKIHNPPAVVKKYLYGPSYNLASARVDGLEVQLRPAAPAGVTVVAGFEGGSCPILFYRHRDQTEWYRLGPVLTRAVGKNSRSLEEYDLPEDVAEIALIETEPERSYIESMVVDRTLSTGLRETVSALKAPVVLNIGEGFVIDVPRRDGAGKLKVSISGYYETYSSMLVASQKLK